MRPHPLDLRPIDVSSTRHECSDYQDNSAARRLELLTEHSTDVLCELREGVITYLSPNAERVSGLRPQDVVGRAFVDILHPEDASALARFAAPGWTGSIEAIFRIADASGAWQWREARGFRDVEANGAHFAVIILRDINDRRRAEEALKQSEERANASLRAIPDFVFRMSRDGRYLDVKAERSEDLYAPPDALIGSRVIDVLPADVAVPAMDLIQRALDDGKVHAHEYQLTKRGDVRDYEARFVASGDDEVVVIARDVTDRARSERALRDSEEKYRSLVERSSDLIYTRDLEGKVTSVNAKALELYGFTEEEALGMNFADLIDPKYLPLAASNMQRALHGEPMASPLEFLTYAKDGTPRWVETVSDPIVVRGEITGFQVIMRDISQRKATEQRVRSQAQMLDAIGQAVVMQNLDGIIQYWNHAAETMLGWSAEQVIGQSTAELFPPVADDVRRAAGERIERNQPWSGELEWRRRDGSLFPTLVVAAPLRDEQGALIGIIVVAAELIGLKKAETEARQAQAQAAMLAERARIAQELHDSVAQFFFGIGLAASELIAGPQISAPTLRRRLRQIKKLATTGGAEVRNTVAHLSATQKTDDLETSLRELLPNGWDSTIQITFSVDISAPLPPQIVNTLYASARETLYNVRKHARASSAHVRVFEIPDHVVLETTDDGKGDPRAIELAIGRANGYGLRSLRRTCQEMGGALSFVRHDPHGLTVRVALPIGGSR